MTSEDLRHQDIQDMRVLLATREGARFLCRLFEATRIFEISYVPQDAGATAFNEGARNVGLRFFADAHKADSNAATLLAKARDERQIEEV